MLSVYVKTPIGYTSDIADQFIRQRQDKFIRHDRLSLAQNLLMNSSLINYVPKIIYHVA